MSAPPDKLGYGFTPVPRRARAARRTGALSADGYDFLAYLYDRAKTAELKHRHECVRQTLAQIKDGLPFTGTNDTLSKRLRRLHEAPERWFDYRTELHGRDHVYVFTLYPDSPSEDADDPSEHCPSIETGDGPSIDPAGNSAARRDPERERATQVRASEVVTSVNLSEHRSRVSEHRDGATPLPKRDSELPPVRPVRASQTVRERAKPLNEGAVGDTESEDAPPAREEDPLGKTEEILAVMREARIRHRTRAWLEEITDPAEAEFAREVVETFDAVLVEESA